VSTSNVLAQIIGGQKPQPPAAIAMPAILAAAQQQAGPPLRIRRHFSEEGQPFWRWDCEMCGEYGGGRHPPDAVSLPPPALCRQRDAFLPLHPMLFAVDDDPPPSPM